MRLEMSERDGRDEREKREFDPIMNKQLYFVFRSTLIINWKRRR